MNKYIFRRDDIRGVFGRDFDERDAFLIAKAFGAWLKTQEKKSLAVGSDNRLSSEKIRMAVLDGLKKVGMEVYDLGTVSTPHTYFAPIHLKLGGAIVITASHNPPDWNGFKLVLGDRTIFGDEIMEVAKLTEAEIPEMGGGAIKTIDVHDSYVGAILEGLKGLGLERKRKRLKVVVDSANGLGGLYAPKVLQKVGCEVIEMHSRLDGTYPNHPPDPMLGPNMLELITRVQKEKADLGMGFDVDLDRLNICDENGFILWGDGLTIFFARDILKRNPRAAILYNTQCSPAVDVDIVAHDGLPVLVPTGHSVVLNELRFYGGLFAGEYKGHTFFADHYFGFDDAVYAAARFAVIASQAAVPVSKFMADVPFYDATGEIIIPCSDGTKFEVVERVKNELRRKFFVNELDGARVKFRDGFEDTWGLVRASNTYPKIGIFVWAKSWENVKRGRDILVSLVNKYL